MIERSKDIVYKEYCDKYQVYCAMVGWLYKDILYYELNALREEYKQLHGDVIELPNYGNLL